MCPERIEEAIHEYVKSSHLGNCAVHKHSGTSMKVISCATSSHCFECVDGEIGSCDSHLEIGNEVVIVYTKNNKQSLSLNFL